MRFRISVTRGVLRSTIRLRWRLQASAMPGSLHTLLAQTLSSQRTTLATVL